MYKAICPFCKKEVEGEDVPTVTKTALGGKYVCHKIICKNVDMHPDHNNIAIIINPGDE